MRRELPLLVLAAIGCASQQSEVAASHANGPVPSAQPSGTVKSPASKAPSDDPATCVDAAFVAEQAWRTATESKVDALLPSFSRCAPASELKQEERFVASFRFERSGALTNPVSTRTTLSSCKVSECISKALAGVRGDPWVGGDEERSVGFEFFLRPHLPPRHRMPANLAFPDEGSTTCGDGVAPVGSGRLAPEVIQKIVRSNYSDMRCCYEAGLARTPTLKGKVLVRFVIERDGSVEKAVVAENTLPDCEVVECVRSAYPKMKFPSPAAGIVTVVYPIMFEPG